MLRTLSAITLVAACSGKQAPSPSAAETLQVSAASLDDTVTVRLGQSALTRDRSLRLSYLRLVTESRCPANAVCVWQGDAAVLVKAEAFGLSIDSTIHTTLDPRILEIGGNRVSLLEVQPYPGAGDPKRPGYIVARVLRENR